MVEEAADARRGHVLWIDLAEPTESDIEQVCDALELGDPASILLLPGTLIAGLAGMNVNLAADTFTSSGLFWSVLVAIVAIAAGTLVLARSRRWI